MAGYSHPPYLYVLKKLLLEYFFLFFGNVDWISLDFFRLFPSEVCFTLQQEG